MATKTTFRHLGYYNDPEDIVTLFGRSADYIVKTMLGGLGAFHKTDGSRDTDIDDYNDEHDANMFQLTTDKKYLVRFERGGTMQMAGTLTSTKKQRLKLTTTTGKYMSSVHIVVMRLCLKMNSNYSVAPIVVAQLYLVVYAHTMTAYHNVSYLKYPTG